MGTFDQVARELGPLERTVDVGEEHVAISNGLTSGVVNMERRMLGGGDDEMTRRQNEIPNEPLPEVITRGKDAGPKVPGVMAKPGQLGWQFVRPRRRCRSSARNFAGGNAQDTESEGIAKKNAWREAEKGHLLLRLWHQ